MFYVAGSKLGDAQLAKEIIQDIFMDVWERRFSLEVNRGLKPYLNVALNYKVINQQAIRCRNLRYQKSVLQQTQGDVDNSTELQLRFVDLKEQLDRLIGDLPEKCQLVFRLSREQGLSHKDIAARLDMSPKTVEAHVAKALHKLRHGLSRLLLLLAFSATCIAGFQKYF